MSETAASARPVDTKDDERLAACFNCKRSKLKCVRSGGSAACTRCKQRRIDCAAPAYHVGRHKGVKNKHTGLEKAVHQIEQALKRTSSAGEQIANQDQANELRYLLERSRELLGNRSALDDYAAGKPDDQNQKSSPNRTSASIDTPPPQALGRDDASLQRGESDHLSLDDAENPLQLLARTSELLSAIHPRVANGPPGYLGHKTSQRNDFDLQKFFGPYQPRLDIGEDLDPIELGLVTLAEAEALFSYFYDKLAHTRWGIDPVIHTVNFVRSRSAFLLTSIAAASALFSPSLESLYKRLSNHRQKLASVIMSKRYKSVEIVLAFMVNIPWISAGEHWADDETSTWLSMALTIALDLSLNKIILPASPEPQTPRDGVATADCLDARKALSLDGFNDLDPMSLSAKRLLRRRERTWLSLFVLERGVCLARGRDYALPMSPLVENCDQWHLSELADRWDGSIVSVAVLRRDLANLINRVRAICDSYVDNNESENGVVNKLKGEINMFFDRWYHTWPLQIGDREQLALPPYVEILASHTRLSMYSSVINHLTAPVAARHFFRAAGLSSALNVLRVAVQGENQLKSMPNNTAIMISCAACFALRVGTVADAHGSSLAPSIRTLIAETTDVLERIGSTPIQRKGLSCLFARQLRQILKLASRASEHARSHAEPSREATTAPMYAEMPHGNTHHNMPMEMAPANMAPVPDFPLFSTMSNVQLDEAINNTDVGLESIWEDFQFQNATDLDWMDWSTFT